MMETGYNAIARAIELRKSEGLPLVDLSRADPIGFLPPFSTELLIEASRRYFLNRDYQADPQGSRDARNAISEWYRINHRVELMPERIIITASTSESYQLLLQSLCPAGSTILVPSPSYPLLDEFALQRGVSTRGVPLRRHAQWRYAPQSFEGFLDQSVAAVVLVSPNNPTGTIVGADELIAIIEVLKHLPYRPPLIIDEVFAQALHGKERTCHYRAMETDYPVILLNGISKSFCAPDLKVGWMGLNEAAWRQYGSPLVYANDLLLSCSGLSQFLMGAMMREGKHYLATVNQSVALRCRRTLELLGERHWLRVSLPQGGWMAMAELVPNGQWRATGGNDERFFERAATNGVVLHPGYFYGVHEAGVWGAFSLLSDEEVLAEGLDILEKLLL
jgi:alanine-synthesizing transaminase